ncbi:MAG: hypothetical protein RR745_04540, partial [Bacilli bacterium]
MTNYFTNIIIKNIKNDKQTKIFFYCLSIIIIFFSIKKYTIYNFYEAISYALTDYKFLCLYYFEVSFYIVLQVNTFFSKNNYITLRLKNNKNADKLKIKTNLILQTYYFLLILCFFIIFYN